MSGGWSAGHMGMSLTMLCQGTANESWSFYLPVDVNVHVDTCSQWILRNSLEKTDVWWQQHL